MTRSTARRVALALLLVALAIDLTSMWGMSRTYDERGHLQFGKNVLDRADLSAWNQSMPVSALNALAVRVGQQLGLVRSPRKELFLARLPTVCLSLLLGALVFRWSSELYGATGGVISLGLYVFDPNIIAHSRVVSTDLPCALAMLGSAYLFVRYLKSPSTSSLVAAAVATGLAQLTKQTALLLFPVFLVLSIIRMIAWLSEPGAKGRDIARRTILHAALFGLIVLTTLNAGYGFRSEMTTGRAVPITSFSPTARVLDTVVKSLPDLPIPVPSAYIEAFVIGSYYNESGRGHGPNYLLGRLSQMGWWYYFPVTVALKAPLGLFLALAISAFLARARAVNAWIDESAALLSATMVFLFFTVFCTAQIGVRYLLPMFPFLCLFCGRLGSLFSTRSAGATIRWRAIQGVAAAALGWYVVSSLSYHPHYISYFNELIGRRTNMYKYLADSNVDWGQNELVLGRFLASRPQESYTINPPEPVSGNVIVNVNRLVGVDDESGDYSWLRTSFEPVAQVGYSWLVYHVPVGVAR